MFLSQGIFTTTVLHHQDKETARKTILLVFIVTPRALTNPLYYLLCFRPSKDIQMHANAHFFLNFLLSPKSSSQINIQCLFTLTKMFNYEKRKTVLHSHPNASSN